MLERISGFEVGEPYTFIECVQTIYPCRRNAPIPSGRTVIPFKVPNLYDRPWRRSGRVPLEGHEAPQERN